VAHGAEIVLVDHQVGTRGATAAGFRGQLIELHLFAPAGGSVGLQLLSFVPSQAMP
jgi:hypothetical protein